MPNMPKRRRNILSALVSRETYGANNRSDLFMLRRLLEKGGHFKKVWQKTSKSPIFYDGNIFFDGYRTSYDLSGLPSKPRCVYQQPKLTSAHRIQSLMCIGSPIDQTTFALLNNTACSESTCCSLGLTRDNYLKVFHPKNGNVLQDIYLSSCHNFKYLQWETDLERILLKSTLTQQRARGAPRITPSDCVVHLVVLTVWPLQFLCMLPISKHVFGSNVTDACIRNDLLIVMCLKGKIMFYNFKEILKNFMVPLKLGDQIKHGNTLDLPEMDEFTAGVIGEHPIGLPVNVNLPEKLPMLFEVVSDNHDLSFGGYPWHYIIKKDQVYEVKSLCSDKPVENGSFGSKALSIETDKAFFHADFSNRILHIEPSILRCLKLDLVSPSFQSDETKEYCLSEQFVMDFSKPTETPNHVYSLTRSGRCVKQLYKSYHGNIESDLILDVDYDDELDILVVMYRDQPEENGAVIGFYDNQTGQTLHTLKFEGLIEEAEHSLAMDRNALIIVSKQKTCFVCTVFVLLPEMP